MWLLIVGVLLLVGIIIDYFVVYRSLGCGVKSAHRSFKP